MSTKGPGIWFKFVVGFFLLAFLPLLAMGVFIFQSGKQDLLKSHEKHQYSMAILLKERIESFTGHAMESTVMLTGIPRLKALARKVTGSNAKDTSLREMRGTLMAFMHMDGDVQAYYFLHPETGEVLCSSNVYDEGKFFDKRPYFASGREGPSISRVHYSPSLEKSILAISAPVFDGGELLGVLVSWVNMDQMTKSIALSSSEQVYLVNQANFHVIHSVHDITDMPIQSGVFTLGAERALSGMSGSAVYPNQDGIRVVGAYAPVEPLDLALLVEAPLEDVMEGANVLGIKVLALVIVLAVAVLAGAMLAGRRLADPLISISRRAEELASGKRLQPGSPDMSRSDEIGSLSVSMHRLAETLALKENELNQLVSTMETLVEHIPEGVVLLDQDNRVVHANPMGENYLQSLVGAKIGDRILHLGAKPIDEFVAVPPSIVWHEVRMGSNSPTIFEVAARSISSGENKEGGKVIVLKDVTLDKEVEGRIQAQERLAAVGHLASGIAHDFNNILTCVIGYSEMLSADENLSSEARQSVDAIKQSGKRAAELIGQILDFSRRSASELEVADLRTLSKEFMRFIERILPENIHIVFEFEPGEYHVRADLTKMLQVLANLAVNARDAMSSGGDLTFTLALVQVDGTVEAPIPDMPSGTWIHIKVSDTGEGIPADVLPHIFEPFYTTKEKEKGSGLGLAQVYGIIKQHHGFIEVESEVERGTEFHIYLPQAESGPAGDGSMTEPESQYEDIPEGHGHVIMVVEDDPIVRDLVSKELSRLGFEIITASNGDDALERCRSYSGEISLVITDIMMPGMHGIELSRELQKLRPGLKIVAITGYSLQENEQDSEGTGIVTWIQKPFNMNTLSSAIGRALGLGRDSVRKGQ